MRCRAAEPRGDSGTATAELAVALPGFVVLLAALVIGGSALVAELRCADAAREGARWAARGESADEVRRVAARSAPDGADIQVTGSGQNVTVVVSVRFPVRFGPGPADRLTISASATAAREVAR